MLMKETQRKSQVFWISTPVAMEMQNHDHHDHHDHPRDFLHVSRHNQLRIGVRAQISAKVLLGRSPPRVIKAMVLEIIFFPYDCFSWPFKLNELQRPYTPGRYSYGH